MLLRGHKKGEKIYTGGFSAFIATILRIKPYLVIFIQMLILLQISENGICQVQ